MRSLICLISIVFSITSHSADINSDFKLLYEHFSFISQLFLDNRELFQRLDKVDIERYYTAKEKLREYYNHYESKMNSAELWLYHNVMSKMEGKDDCNQLMLFEKENERH